MRVIKATIPMIESRVLIIGFVGENERTQVRIDCTAILTEYPHASPSLAIKPPVGAVYPVVVSREDNEVVWNVSNADLQNEGDGELQLTFIKDGVVAKTVIGKLRISRSLLVTGEQPDVIQTWYDAATEKLAEVDAQIVELEGMVDTATDAATRAEQSEDNATTAAANAATSAATASTKAAEAQVSADTATAKAAEAALSATQAINSAVSAADSERGAIAKAAEAAQSAQTATTKAGQATEAAQTATGKAGEASASATAAQASATNAAASATAASASQTAAKASETAASTSETQAATSAQNASTAAQTATQKAAEATQSATNAATSEQTATTKAGEAAASAQAASDAQTAAEETAEQLADSLAQIAQNAADIADLQENKANIDGYYQDMTVGDAEQLISSQYVEDKVPYLFRPTGGSVDVGNRSDTEAIVGGTIAWNQLTPDTQAENTATGDIVSVDDASAENAVSVKASFEPVQDLHGYDHPWPGGGVAQMIPNGTDTQNGYVAGRVLDAQGRTINNTSAYVSEYFPVVAGEQYTISCKTALVSPALCWYDGNKTYISGDAFNGATSKTITAPENAAYARCTQYIDSDSNKTQCEKGTTATIILPYSNICPITGFTGANVTRTGGNQFIDNPFTSPMMGVSCTLVSHDNSVSLSGTASQTIGFATVRADVKAGVTYTASVDGADSNCVVILRAFKGSTFVTVLKAFQDSSSITFTPDGSYDSIDMRPTVPGGQTVDNKTIKYSLNIGETPAAYEPHQGTTLSVSWQTEAGTVYGGELDVTTGVLTATMMQWTAPKTGWGIYTSGAGYIFYYTVLPSETVDVISNTPSNHYYSVSDTFTHYTSPDNWWNNAPNCGYVYNVSGVSGQKRVWIHYDGDNFEDIIEGAKFVFLLQTPQTYQLTAQQLQMLLGENHVWNDAGSTTLTYISPNKHHTLTTGRKYLARISGADSVLTGAGQEVVAACGTDNLFDLTQMWGTSIADYIASTGGAAWFRNYFPNAVYPYNAGELRSVEGLESHDTVGFNAWDGGFSALNGYLTASGSILESRSQSENVSDYIRVVSGAQYYISPTYGNASAYAWYDCNKQFLVGYQYNGATSILAVAPYNACYLRATIYKPNIDRFCINLSHSGARNGEYEPYVKHSYPLDSSVVLRGIPKLDSSNSLYFDGDEYLPDGTVERRYGVVDMGTITWTYNSSRKMFSSGTIRSAPIKSAGSAESARHATTNINYMFNNSSADKIACCGQVGSWNNEILVRDLAYENAAAFKAAMQGVLLVYELATPTTEQATPYQQHQIVSDWGTEEYVGDSFVPVGHVTHYPANLRDKLQHLPDLATADGLYLIQQSGSQMSLQSLPATAGKYALRVTVSGGIPSYTWEAVT